jgi:hypothetical protein
MESKGGVNVVGYQEKLVEVRTPCPVRAEPVEALLASSWVFAGLLTVGRG